jgi:hypothetical protein
MDRKATRRRTGSKGQNTRELGDNDESGRDRAR